MYTEDQIDIVDSHMAARRDHERPRSPHGPSRITGIGVFLVVALLVGVSVVVFTSWKAQRPAVGTTTPADGQWVHMLDGYTVSSLIAARSDPGTLYTCVTPFQAASSPGAVPSPGTNGSTGSSGGAVAGGSGATTGSSGVTGGGSTGTTVASNVTIMRTTDYGVHWQDIGAKAALQGSCELAVDPANSQSLYVVDAPLTVSNQSSAVTVLKHSSDGGQTWSTITPRWDTTVKAAKTLWSISSLTVEGGRLFGMQWLLDAAAGQSGAEPSDIPLGHIVESRDGGATWSVLNNAFGNVQGVQRYAVDPTNPAIIYAVVGTPFTGSMGVPEGKVPGNVYSMNEELYKTTDSGESWKLLLNNLYYGASVQVASGKPETIYAGGMLGPVPLAGGAGASTGAPSQSGSGFLIRVSSDGGADWRNVPMPTKIAPTQNWFVDANGRLFMAAGGITGSNEGGTAVPPATSVVTPQIAPAQGKSAPVGTGATMRIAPEQRFSSYVDTTVSGVVQLQWYDPSTGSWSAVLQAPLYGSLLAITSNSAGIDVIWLAEYTNNGQGVARYIM